jgi:hypothetical protein
MNLRPLLELFFSSAACFFPGQELFSQRRCPAVVASFRPVPDYDDPIVALQPLSLV